MSISISVSSASHSPAFAREFPRSVLSSLSSKGVRLVDKQGDRYQLVTVSGINLERVHSQILTMARSSWMPDDGEEWQEFE